MNVQEVLALFRSHDLPIVKHGRMMQHKRGIERGGLECKQHGPVGVLVQWEYTGAARVDPEATKEMTDVLLRAAEVALKSGYIVKFPITDRIMTGPDSVSDHDVSGGALVVYAPAVKK